MSTLSHEANELILYIKNNEQAYNAVKTAVRSPKLNLKPYIEQCKANYKREYAKQSDFIFSDNDINQVVDYFLNLKTIN